MHSTLYLSFTIPHPQSSWHSATPELICRRPVRSWQLRSLARTPTPENPTGYQLAKAVLPGEFPSTSVTVGGGHLANVEGA